MQKASNEKKIVKFQNGLSSDEEEDTDESGEDLNRQFNKFQLLDADGDEVDHGSDDSAENESDDDYVDGEQEDAAESKQSTILKEKKAGSSSQAADKKPNRKRRNKAKVAKSDDIDDLIQLYGADKGASTSKDSSSQPLIDPRIKLLKLDMRNLIPEAELKRMFGKSVLKEDKSKEQKSKINALHGQFRSRFVTDSQDARIIAALSIPGPKMELDDVFNVQEQWKVGSKKNDQSETVSDKKPTSKRANKHNKANVFKSETPTYFKFVHDKNYQAAQMLFLEAAQVGNSDAIIANLNAYPVHIESLVQLSDMIRVTEDFKAASEFVERALLVFEKGFHVKFNPATANCRLSYKRPENRTFFITIFKHIYYCNRRGLRRTPLEYTKLLLALDPETDPLFATLMIDFYAIRSEEYDYLIEFAEKWTNMAKLPNINFSLALAHFMKSKNLKFGKSVCESSAQLANELLEKALLRFPNFIISLLEACSAEPDTELKKCDYFDYSVYGTRYKTVPEAVELLVALYVERTSMLWKQKQVLTWLESVIADIVKRFANKELKDDGLNYKHWTVFEGPSPRNLLRHIALSDMKLKVPASSTQASFLDIDPYPPESLPSYTSHAAQIASGGANNTSNASLPGFPGLFLRSILPSFSLTNNEQTNNSNNNDNNRPT